MVKENYNVQNNDQKSSNNQTIIGQSYKSFICAILVFLVFCLILVLITIILLKSNSEFNSEKQNVDLETSSTSSAVNESVDENRNDKFNKIQSFHNSNQNKTDKILVINKDITSSTTTSSTTTTDKNKSDDTPTTTTDDIVNTSSTRIATRPTSSNEKKALNKWIASKIFYQMNFLRDPCTNFYDYACGRKNIQFKDQSKTMHILSTKLSDESIFKKEFNYMKTFYDSCINYEKDFNFKKQIRNVEKLTKELGNFMFNDNDDSNDPIFKRTELFAKLTIRQSNPLFDIGLDVEETSNIILQITLPEGSALRNGLKTWSSLTYHKKQCLQMENIKTHQSNPDLNNIYQSYRRCSKDFTPYLNSIKNVISHFDFGNLNPDDKLNEINDIGLSVEKILRILNEKMTRSTHEIHSDYEEKKYQSIQISELNSDFIDWENFFKQITNKTDSDTKIHFYFKDDFENMFQSLSGLSPRKLNNGLLAIYANDLFMNTAILRETDRRDHFCSDLSKQLLPTVWSNLLYQDTLHNNNKYYNPKTVQKLFDQLKNRIYGVIRGIQTFYLSFVDIRFKILDLKLALVPFEEISSNFDVLEIDQDFQTNLIRLLSSLRRNIYSLAGAPISNKNIFSYLLDPLSTKPQSFYHSNIIAVPIGLLKKGIDDDMPNYVTLAHVGFHMAREIFRHFDLIGKNIKIENKKETLQAYSQFQENIKQKIKKSAKIFEHTNVISVNLDNTSLPVNEVIRTDAAFKLISDLFKQDEVQIPYLSFILEKNPEEQLFHIIAAQEFCEKQEIGELAVNLLEKMKLPGEIIVNNFALSSENFSSTFDCKIGSTTYDFQGIFPVFPYFLTLHRNLTY